MTSPRVEVLLWAKRVVAKKAAEPHTLLEVQADATIDQAQEAFHKIARIAHPDLHRTTLNAEELELVTTAYAHAANAYQQFRASRLQTARVPTVKAAAAPDPKAKRAGSISLPGGGVIRGTGTTRPPISTTNTPVSRTQTPISHAPTSPLPTTPAAPAEPVAEPVPAPAATHGSGQMNNKALIYYRKAELALRQGDLRVATLNLKMAIAADPQSGFLRSALAEVEAETKK